MVGRGITTEEKRPREDVAGFEARGFLKAKKKQRIRARARRG